MFHAAFNDPPLVDISGGLPADQVREYIPDGDAGTAETIKRMQQLVGRGKRDKEVRVKVGEIIAPCQNKNHLCYLKALYEFSKTKIKYAFDPNMVEFIENPAYVLRSKIADCDSIVVVLCSMAEGIGLASEFVTVKADPQRPNEFSHVYCRSMVPGVGWVSMDPTMPKQNFGWEVPGAFPRKYWHASPDDKGTPDSTPSISEADLAGALSTADAKYSNQLTGLRMSGLACAGNSDCGCGCKKPMAGLGWLQQMRGMGALGETQQEASIYKVLTGETLSDIYDQKKAYLDNAAVLDQKARTIAAMPPGAEKNRAVALKAAAEESLRQQFVAYRQYRDAYNEFVTKISPYVPDSLRPSIAGLSGLSGLGAIPLAYAAIIAAIAAAGLLALIDKMTSYQLAAHGKDVETRGYIEQMSDLTTSIGGTALKVGLVAGVGFLGYLFLKSRGLVKG